MIKAKLYVIFESGENTLDPMGRRVYLHLVGNVSLLHRPYKPILARDLAAPA